VVEICSYDRPAPGVHPVVPAVKTNGPWVSEPEHK
jgi:hypothetical protein